MQDLEIYAARLRDQPTLFFHVKNEETGSTFKNATKKNQAFLNENFSGDISQYINSFKERGESGVVIIPRLPNGKGSSKPDPIQQDISISFKRNNASLNRNEMITTPQKATDELSAIGLKQYAEGVSAINSLKETKTLLAESKQQVKDLEKARDNFKDRYKEVDGNLTINAAEMVVLKKKLKKFKSLKKFKKKNKEGGGLNGALENPILLSLLEKVGDRFLNNPVPASVEPGKSSPSSYGNDPNFDEVKNQFIKNASSFPGAILGELNRILIAYKNNDTELIEQFKELINMVPNLQKVSNDV
jgi:hypothetical protein